MFYLIQSMYINKYINTTSPNPALNSNTEFATCAGRMLQGALLVGPLLWETFLIQQDKEQESW